MLLVIGACFATAPLFAQDGAEAAADSIAERKCIPADEAEQSTGADSGPSEEGDSEEDGMALPVCEEADPAAPVPDEDTSGEETANAEQMDIDPGQEFEVDPEDEISEDYPVPLPSDS